MNIVNDPNWLSAVGTAVAAVASVIAALIGALVLREQRTARRAAALAELPEIEVGLTPLTATGDAFIMNISVTNKFPGTLRWEACEARLPEDARLVRDDDKRIQVTGGGNQDLSLAREIASRSATLRCRISKAGSKPADNADRIQQMMGPRDWARQTFYLFVSKPSPSTTVRLYLRFCRPGGREHHFVIPVELKLNDGD